MFIVQFHFFAAADCKLRSDFPVSMQLKSQYFEGWQGANPIKITITDNSLKSTTTNGDTYSKFDTIIVTFSLVFYV